MRSLYRDGIQHEQEVLLIDRAAKPVRIDEPG